MRDRACRQLPEVLTLVLPGTLERRLRRESQASKVVSIKTLLVQPFIRLGTMSNGWLVTVGVRFQDTPAKACMSKMGRGQRPMSTGVGAC